MKRFALLILAFFVLTTGQAFAQDSGVITLNNATPNYRATITLPANATGTVTINLNQAVVTLTDANGMVVFSSADPRVHHLELNIAPNSGSHTLTLQRLPGVALAAAQVGSQADLTSISPALLVDTNTISLQQQHSLSLDAAHPVGQVALDIQPNTTGLITANFPDAAVTSQLTDTNGMLIATSSRDINGFNAILDGGTYNLSVQANSLNSSTTAGVSVTPADQFTILKAPQAPVRVSASCTATVASSSVNLRSGPGTGYSVLNSASQGDKLTVGGVNPEGNWVVVAANGGSAWVDRSLASLNGDCTQLKVFNIPFRDTPAPQVVVQSASSSAPSTSTTAYHGDDGSGDHQQSSGGDHENSGGDN